MKYTPFFLVAGFNHAIVIASAAPTRGANHQTARAFTEPSSSSYLAQMQMFEGYNRQPDTYQKGYGAPFHAKSLYNGQQPEFTSTSAKSYRHDTQLYPSFYNSNSHLSDGRVLQNSHHAQLNDAKPSASDHIKTKESGIILPTVPPLIKMWSTAPQLPSHNGASGWPSTGGVSGAAPLTAVQSNGWDFQNQDTGTASSTAHLGNTQGWPMQDPHVPPHHFGANGRLITIKEPDSTLQLSHLWSFPVIGAQTQKQNQHASSSSSSSNPGSAWTHSAPSLSQHNTGNSAGKETKASQNSAPPNTWNTMKSVGLQRQPSALDSFYPLQLASPDDQQTQAQHDFAKVLWMGNL